MTDGLLSCSVIRNDDRKVALQAVEVVDCDGTPNNQMHLKLVTIWVPHGIDVMATWRASDSRRTFSHAVGPN